ncbi:MAG: hypothetical protein ABI366_04730 [Ginsengibacter sp.]
MKNSTEILNELKAISPVLAEIEKVNVFSVPEGYFIGLDEKIATTVFLQQDKKIEFQKIPEGYFDSLSSRILSKIKEEESAEEEIRSISLALHYLKEENVFNVPEGYFDNLSTRILRKIKGEETKIVSFNAARKWWKYAAAAIVAGIITLFSYQLFISPSSNNSVITASSEMPEYVQMASQYKTVNEINQGIASLSDEEIAKYLEKSTTILDDEALIKNTDTKELPTPNDYLLDDNALNNYLQKINVESIDKNTQ